MSQTIDTECRLGVYFLSLEQEGVFNCTLADMALHKHTSFLLLLRVYQGIDHIEGSWVLGLIFAILGLRYIFALRVLRLGFSHFLKTLIIYSKVII